MRRRTFLVRTGWASVAWMSHAWFPAYSQEPQWEEGSSYEAQGLRITLSKPRLVLRSGGFLWFPAMHHLGNGRLLAVLYTRPDEAADILPAAIVYSENGGLTWSKPLEGYYSEAAVRLANGDLLLLPMYLRLKSDAWAAESAYLWTTSKEYRKADRPVEVIGWPRKIMLLPADLGNPKPEWKIASFVFNGQTLLAQDGKTYLATLYGRFAGTRRYSLVLAESVNGFQWKIRSVIADETCKLQGKEGPCESALVRLKDGRLLCVYRLDSGVTYGHSFSDDDGKNWTEPKNLEGTHSVQPSLDMSEDGMLLLSGGRPGLFLWLNRAGDVRRWDRLDLQAHHNQWAKTDPITKAQLHSDSNTSSYTEVRWLDRRSFVVIYDRLANGWRAIPPDSTATNSIWLVHGTIG